MLKEDSGPSMEGNYKGCRCFWQNGSDQVAMDEPKKMELGSRLLSDAHGCDRWEGLTTVYWVLGIIGFHRSDLPWGCSHGWRLTGMHRLMLKQWHEDILDLWFKLIIFFFNFYEMKPINLILISHVSNSPYFGPSTYETGSCHLLELSLDTSNQVVIIQIIINKINRLTI